MARERIHPGVGAARLLIVVAALCTTAWAVEFAGGTGYRNDPYQIATAQQLMALGEDPNLYNRHFVLIADIDLDPSLPGRRVFQKPILTWTFPRRRSGGPTGFAGTLDGHGHVIRNGVLFDLTDSSHSGFVGKVGLVGEVRNLHLEDFVIAVAGQSRACAILAGENAGWLSHCSATGTVIAGPAEAGGLVAYNRGVLVNCSARCNVFGSQAGGLVGANDATGRIVSCSADGWVDAGQAGWPYTAGAGGLVALNEGRIQYCSTGGTVSGYFAGGLVGTNSGLVRECYSLATASGTRGAGLIWQNDAHVVNCYAMGLAGGDGLVGANHGSIVASYSTSPAQAQSTSRRTRSLSLGEQSIPGSPSLASQASDDPTAAYVPGEESGIRYLYYLDPNRTEQQPVVPLAEFGIPLSDSQMQQQASFVGFDFYGDPNDGAHDA
ncbi:MAG: GLUG motif-containing protein, partial [Planctomycetota bacterium]